MMSGFFLCPNLSDRDNNGMSVNDIVKLTGIPRSTIYAKTKATQ